MNSTALLLRTASAAFVCSILPCAALPPAQSDYIKASNAATFDHFGQSVAMSGDTMVVGAWQEDSSAVGVNAPGGEADNGASSSGAAYVFVRNAGGVWTQQAYLKASNTGINDGFGEAVAISGDTIAVGVRSEAGNGRGVNPGAAAEADNSAAFSGAVYVFVRNGGVWTQQAYIKSSNSEAFDQFGGSVSLSGDTLVVGASQEDSNATGASAESPPEPSNDATNSGAVYVFTRAGGVWMQQAYLKASNTGTNDFFGNSVSISGDTIIAGARGEGSNATGVNSGETAEANNGAVSSGAAYVFTRSGGVWTQEAWIKPSNTGASDLFGFSVALSGDTAVVGSINEASNATGVNAGAAAEADNSAAGAGAAYVFVRNAGVWSQQAYLKASNTGGLDNFGTSVAILDHTIAVGVAGEDSNATGINPGAAGEADNSLSGAGAAYVFQRLGTEWSQFAYVKASNTGLTDSFGRSVALAGDLLIVGATGEASKATGINPGGDAQSNDEQVRAGAVYVFTGFTSPVQPVVTAKPVITNFSLTPGPGGRAVNLSGKGQALTNYRLEASATLQPPWQTLQTMQSDGAGSFTFPTFHEPFATLIRFYRVAGQ